MAPDPSRFAALLCDYCLDVQPGQQVVVRSTTLAAPLLLALQEELLVREAWPLIRFLFADPVEDAGAWEKVMTPDALDPLTLARDALRSTDGFTAESLEAALTPIVEGSGRKPRDVYQPIRVAITGTTISPGIFESLSALGREESLRRIDAALRRLGG